MLKTMTKELSGIVPVRIQFTDYMHTILSVNMVSRVCSGTAVSWSASVRQLLSAASIAVLNC